MRHSSKWLTVAIVTMASVGMARRVSAQNRVGTSVTFGVHIGVGF